MAEILREALPDATISTSSGVLPELFEHERFSTTVANAVLSPLVSGYVARSRAAPQGRRLRRRPADPALRRRRDDAGGRAEARRAARRVRASRPAPSPPATPPRCAATSNVIGVDMGGTSTDISTRLRRRAAHDQRVVRRVRAPDLLPVDRGAHDRRRRRLAGDDRRGRLAAQRPAVRGLRPGPGGLRQGRRGADEHRRQPRARPARQRSWSAAACRSTATPPSRRSARRSREPLGARPARGGRRDHRASPTRTWPTPCGSSRCSAATTRASSRWSSSAAPARCTAPRSPKELGDPDGARAAAPGHLVGARLPDGRHPPRPVGDVPAPRPPTPTRTSSTRRSTRLEDEGRELLQAEGVADDDDHGSSARSPCATSASGARWRCASTRRSRPRRRGRALPRRARARVLLPPRRRAGRALPAPADRRRARPRRSQRSAGTTQDDAAMPEPDRAARPVWFDGSTSRSRRPSTSASDLPAGASFEGPAVIDQLDTTTLVPPGRAAPRSTSG